MQFRIYRYDVWGNEEDGYEVNDTYRTSEIYELCANWTDKQVIAAIEGRGIEISWLDEDTCLISTKTGKPLGELRREETNG